MTFLSKYSKFYGQFETLIKLQGNVNGFGGNCVWTCCGTFCQLSQEYMCCAVNVLKRAPKISDPTKRHDTQLNFFDMNGRLG